MNPKFSPLFEPVFFEDGVVHVLDETLLPDRVSYLEVRTVRQACEAIRAMKTRAVGQVLLVFCTFRLELQRQKNQKDELAVVRKVAEALNVTRPTLSFRFLTDMVLGWAAAGVPLEPAITGFIDTLKQARLRQAQEASLLLKDGDTVLTHCNVSGLLPLIAELGRKDGKKIAFFATETRPYLQGSRLTAWELHRQNVPVTVIADNMAARVMQEDKVSCVLVGADHLAANGDIANKVGTLQLAILARHFGLPFYVLCPPASGTKTGRDIAVEVRPDTELLEYRGLRLAPKGVRGYYPAFDITPNDLITRHLHLKLESA